MKVSLLTGGIDPHYAFALLTGLILKEIDVDLIGSDYMKDSAILSNENVHFYNLRGDQSPYAPIKEKIIRVTKYYFKLLKYTATTDSKIFHIQWLNKFTYLDRTFLNVYYKILGKKLVFTAHNIDIKERDGESTLINKLSLKFMYKIVDHIFVHTENMKLQLIKDFNIKEEKITVIPFGINIIVPKSKLLGVQAKKKLFFEGNEKIILYFGKIAPYKGLEYLISALVNLKEKFSDFKLIIAGQIKHKDYESYWENIQRLIEKYNLKDYIIKKIEFIPDEDIEVYFKSADVLILPYKYIFQSGVIFLSYSFGLPVIATDVGSLKEDIIEGETGFISRPEDPQDLAEKIELFFNSDLYKNLETNRSKIIEYANEKYSWDKIGEKTYEVYKNLLGKG